MSISRKNLLSIIFILFIYLWFFISQTAFKKDPPPVITATNSVSVFIQPESGRDPLIKAINSAQKEILIEVYLLSDKEIVDSLKKAKSRGVSVMIIMEKHPFGGNNSNNKTKQELDRSGITTKWSNNKFALTHQKTIVIDSQKAFILNQNLTPSSFSKNREYNILDTNQNDVLQLRNIFISDWEGKNFDPQSSSIIESPNTSRTSIISLIKKAQKNIDIEIEVIEDREILQLLAEKSNSVQIRLLIPPLNQINSNTVAVNLLKQKGVVVKKLTNPYVHAKLILVDAKFAYIGSINLSSQSMDQNREAGIILSNLQISQTLSQTFQNDWNSANPF